MKHLMRKVLFMIQSLWQYREFIYSSVRREFETKYKGSILGASWSILHPLSIIFVYTVIFSTVMKSKLAGMNDVPFAYSIYLCAGVLTWGFFTEVLTRCINVFLDNANLLKKVSFPRICLPVTVTLSSLLNFSIAFLIYIVFLLIIGKFPEEKFFGFFVILFVQVAFSVALGIGLGVLNVFFRDIGQFLAMGLQFWFWFTPIVYPIGIIPTSLQWLLNFNPMYHIVTGYQNIFVYGQWPNFVNIGLVFLLSILIGFWTIHLYHKHVGEMVDEL